MSVSSAGNGNIFGKCECEHRSDRGVAAVYIKAHFSSMWHSPRFLTEQSTRKNWTWLQYNFPALDLSMFPHLFPSPTEWNSFTSYQPSWWYGCRAAICGRTVCASWFEMVMSCMIHYDEDHNGWWHDMIENSFSTLFRTRWGLAINRLLMKQHRQDFKNVYFASWF